MTASGGSDGRAIWRIVGDDVPAFLQRIVTADVTPLREGPGMVWTTLLSPQGKYLADFFIARQAGDAPGEFLIDIPAVLAPATMQRLMLYRLRAAITFEATGLHPIRGTDAAPADALPDPRHPAMGWRRWAEDPGPPCPVDWDALRIEHRVPEFPADLVPDETYILEAGFERLHGVSFRKGCYIGQEVTARMKHKAVLRRSLRRVRLGGSALPGTPVTLEDGREAGRLGTVSGNRGLAMLRLDRVNASLFAGDTTLAVEPE